MGSPGATETDPEPGPGFSVALAEAGQLAIFTLNRPDRHNCQSPELWTALLETFNALPGTVRIVVVEAEGPSFSSGLDRELMADDGPLGELARADAGTASSQIGRYQQAFAAFTRPGIVSIALVQGHAIGAGFQLALACDLRIAVDDARFAMPETSLGLVPDLGGTKRLVELVGYGRAVGICLTGRRVGAYEAERIGLVHEVVPRDELRPAGERLVRTLLAVPRSAMSETKALLLSAADNSIEAQQQAEQLAQHRQLQELAPEQGEDLAG